VAQAAIVLGNGAKVTSQDTVPLCLWIASRWLGDYVEALWRTVEALGDRDTNCAIVGGIVACHVGRESIPSAWLATRETLVHGIR
jgi:ADP-ribosylglycohydrolase